MDTFIVVLESILILLGIGFIGFWITRRGIIPENVHVVLTRLAIDIALPCMVFSNIIVNFSPSEFPDWWQLPLWWLGFATTSIILTILTKFISRKETRPEFCINLFYQNGLFFPLIIISGIFGVNSPYIPQLYIFIIFHPVMFFSTYQYFFKNGEKKLRLNRIFNHIFITTILAVIIRLFGFSDYLPSFIQAIFEILGAMALPLIMIILGGSLYLDFQQKGKIYRIEILKFIVTKNLIFPAVFLGLLLLIRTQYEIPYSIALLLILESAVPPITGTPIVTERAGGNKSISTQFVFTSFISSMVSIPAIFYLFSQFFSPL
ncbi:AEC family transporter [Chloroflexota bacterium]